MRILYLSQSYVPSRRADSIQVMKMCAAMARLGHRVRLVTKRCPARQEAGIEDDHRFYGVEPAFEIAKQSRPALRGGAWIYAWHVARELRRQRRSTDLVYSRDLWGAYLAARMGLPLVLEAHGVPAGRFLRAQLARAAAAPGLRRLVAISRALLEDLERQGLVPAGAPTLVAHDAAEPLPEPPPRPAAAPEPGGRRWRLGYVGHLYPGRGVELIRDLAARLPECEFHLVGGHDHAVEDWRRRTGSDNLVFRGFVPPGRLAAVYAELDILLMPHQRAVGVESGRSDIVAWMSPMKMFEYMASGRPIVASDLPVLREVLVDGRNALLAPPDDLDAWQRAIERLLADPALGARLGREARTEQLREHTWEARARRVLEGL